MSAPANPSSSLVDWRAVSRGAFTGVVVLVPLSVAVAIIARNVDDFEDTGWQAVLLLVLLFIDALAGWVAGRLAPGAPLTNGALAGLGVLVVWIPIRVLIWLARDDAKGLFTGDEPVFTVGGLFLLALLAVALGMFGGRIAARRAATDARD